MEAGRHGNYYVCKQSTPCCRTPILELLNDGIREKLVRPITGPLTKAWGLGSVWVTCCGAIYGMYYDFETTLYLPIYLGDNYDEALGRVNHVKLFLYRKGAGQ